MSNSDYLPDYPLNSDLVKRLKSALDAKDEERVGDLICTEVTPVDAVIELANDDWMKDPSAQLPPGMLLGDLEHLKPLMDQFFQDANVVFEINKDEMEWQVKSPATFGLSGLWTLEYKRELTTPLCIAAAHGHAACVRYLLGRGADPDASPGGRGALHEACLGGHTTCARLLLQHRADPDLLSAEGLAPLHLCRTVASLGCAQALLEHRASVQRVGGKGRDTPLHVAAQRGLDEHARLYLDRGAYVDARNGCGETGQHLIMCDIKATDPTDAAAGHKDAGQAPHGRHGEASAEPPALSQGTPSVGSSHTVNRYKGTIAAAGGHRASFRAGAVLCTENQSSVTASEARMLTVPGLSARLTAQNDGASKSVGRSLWGAKKAYRAISIAPREPECLSTWPRLRMGGHHHRKKGSLAEPLPCVFVCTNSGDPCSSPVHREVTQLGRASPHSPLTPSPVRPRTQSAYAAPFTSSHQVLKTCASAPAVLEVLFNSYPQLCVSESWKELIPEEVFQMHKPFYQSLFALAHTPRCLQHLCRCALRRLFGKRCFDLIPLLPLPKPLQNYVLLEPQGVLH
nr:ankyrin repeat and SOCS box protein 18 [Macaca nemestrina]